MKILSVNECKMPERDGYEWTVMVGGTNKRDLQALKKFVKTGKTLTIKKMGEVYKAVHQ
jgi:hypothetical protein